MPRKYRPRTPLDVLIKEQIDALYATSRASSVGQVATRLMGDPRKMPILLADRALAERYERRGADAMIRNVVQQLTMEDGPHQGVRACLLVPWAGNTRSGYIQFTPRMNPAEWRAWAAKMTPQYRGLGIAIDVAEAIAKDLEQRQAASLEAAYGPIRLSL